MKDILKEERFNFVSKADKDFVLAFDDGIRKLGYDSGGAIGDGFCWGRYMIIYAKAGVKSKNVAARIYFRDGGIVLRLFLSGIDGHRGYIEKAPDFIKKAFQSGWDDCDHCHNDKGGACKFRKGYTIDDQLIEKCNGKTFEFHNPNMEKLPAYMNLLSEFYSKKM